MFDSSFIKFFSDSISKSAVRRKISFNAHNSSYEILIYSPSFGKIEVLLNKNLTYYLEDGDAFTIGAFNNCAMGGMVEPRPKTSLITRYMAEHKDKYYHKILLRIEHCNDNTVCWLYVDNASNYYVLNSKFEWNFFLLTPDFLSVFDNNQRIGFANVAEKNSVFIHVPFANTFSDAYESRERFERYIAKTPEFSEILVGLYYVLAEIPRRPMGAIKAASTTEPVSKQRRILNIKPRTLDFGPDCLDNYVFMPSDFPEDYKEEISLPFPATIPEYLLTRKYPENSQPHKLRYFQPNIPAHPAYFPNIPPYIPANYGPAIVMNPLLANNNLMLLNLENRLSPNQMNYVINQNTIGCAPNGYLPGNVIPMVRLRHSSFQSMGTIRTNGYHMNHGQFMPGNGFTNVLPIRPEMIVRHQIPQLDYPAVPQLPVDQIEEKPEYLDPVQTVHNAPFALTVNLDNYPPLIFSPTTVFPGSRPSSSFTNSSEKLQSQLEPQSIQCKCHRSIANDQFEKLFVLDEDEKEPQQASGDNSPLASSSFNADLWNCHE